MKETTKTNLKDAFAGESQAHVRYAVYADRAEREGLPNIARLFRATSLSEQVHAMNHLKALGLGVTADHVGIALEGETHEVESMYPGYMQVAEDDEEKRAFQAMRDAWEAEKVHMALFGHAKSLGGADVATVAIFVCPVCGYTMEGETPERCPVCNAPKSKFITF